MTTKDLILLFLYVPGVENELCEPISGRTRFTKLIFIFKKEFYKRFKFDKYIEEDDLPNFYPYDFGPFSIEVFEDLEFLSQSGFIESNLMDDSGDATYAESMEYEWWKEETEYNSREYSEYIEEEFRLTDEIGKKFIEEEGLYDQLSDNQKKVLSKFKKRFSNAPLNAILKYVYNKYPEMAEKSEIRDKFLKER